MRLGTGGCYLTMKILLDKCTNERLRHHLPGHVVHTARYLGWDTLSNGDLLESADQAGYDILISADKDMFYTQDISSWKVTVVFIQQNRPLTDEFIAEVQSAISQV